ncbi:MAG: DVUA0089 family protein, partial [Planctomycetota bacterium]
AGLTQVSGDTANGANNASAYANISNDALTWNNELVYQFDLTSSALLTLDFSFETDDTDVFLLDGLDVVGGIAQNGLQSLFLDGGPESAFLTPGTYFFSVDTFGGFEGAGPTSSAFTLDITSDSVVVPTADIALGSIAADTDTFSIDTIGSDFDTELGLFSSDGLLLANNDDIEPGNTQSILEDLQLPAGDYLFAVGGFNTVFGSGFQVEPGAANGNFAGQANGVQFGGLLDGGAIQWVSFNVTPAPGAGALLAIGGLAAVRRRRA